MRLALLVLLAVPAAAQPSGRALLDAWLDGWDRASRDVEAVELDERSVRTVDGPRGEVVVEIDAGLRYTPGDRPRRDVRRVRVDGREVEPERGPRQGRRLGRAFGRAGREVSAPPPPPHVVLAGAEPVGVEPDRYDGRPAWRVAFQTRGGDDGAAWFTRSETAPRLLGVRVEGRRPRDGRIAREVRYTRVGGLDVPASSEAALTVRQRRRLRDYGVRVTASATYSGWRVRRAGSAQRSD